MKSRTVQTMRRVFGALMGLALLASLAGRTIATAAVATPASDTLTRLKISLPADHQIVFTSPTGIDASSDTITLNLPAFAFGSVSFSDISFAWGPTTGFENPETVAAAAGVGVWGASISGQVVTLTAPTDSAPGSIPGGSVIGIRIGLNAGGANQLTNPASPQNALVGIGGTFGDANTMVVAVVSDDSVAVTATVPSPSGGGGGGGGADVTPPVISNVQAINVTTTAATITWDTNEIANSTVDYGLTMSYASGSVSDGSYVTSHVLNLSGLTPGTTYHFLVSSTDTSGNPASAFDFTFTTTSPGAGPDVTPPIISNIQVVNITDTSALVTWDTDEAATSPVTYGTSTFYGSSASSPGLSTSHSVQLFGLSPGTSYHFFVTSSDGSGNSASSPDGQFVTLSDSTPPANVSNLTATPGDTIVNLSWTNPGDVDFAGTKIMRKTGGYPTGPFDGVLVYDGTGNATTDTGLVNGVTYYYGAYAYDANSNFASGALANATPNGPPPTPTPENTDAVCSNGVDDDIDGQIDCFDPDCSATPICQPPPTIAPENTSAACSNGADDDKDGATDCLDTECSTLPVCQPVPPTPTTTPQIPPPTNPPPNSTSTATVVVHYFANGGAIELTPDGSGRVGALAGSTVTVSVPVANLGKSVAAVQLSVAGSLYSLQPSAGGTQYSGSFTVPPPGLYPIIVTVVFQDNSSAQARNLLNAQGGGRVVEQSFTGPSNVPVGGTTVQLFRGSNGSWTLYATQQSDANGVYAFIVPNGEYYTEVSKDGYQKSVSVPIFVTQNVYNDLLTMIAFPTVIPTPDDASLAERASIAAQNLAAQAGFAANVARAVLQNPQVQAANAVAAPALVALTIINTASALSLFNILAYLQYAFTQPLLLLGRRKRRKYGIVFNSLTKQPIDLAIVRLIHFETRLVVQTKVTDKFGRYVFVAHKGNYLLEVVKPGYVFPTQHLKGKKEDVDYVDLYHGAQLSFTQDTAISSNIPLDPVTVVETPRRILFRRSIQTLRHALAFSSIPLGVIVLIISPGIVTALLLLGQIGIYLLFRRIAVPSKAKNWGITFDAKSRKPVDGVIVRIFDKKFNKLLETQVTDKNGKYGFFVRRNVYYVTAEKAGYKKYVSKDIDLSAKDQAVIDQNIPLQKAV